MIGRILTKIFFSLIIFAGTGFAKPDFAPPEDIFLDNNTVDENQPAGTGVGVLTTNDADAVDSHTYTLAPGTGDTDNGSFVIEADSLLTNSVFDYETKATYAIRIRATDGEGNFVEKEFIIQVNDLPDQAPEITSNGGGDTATVKVEENTTLVTTVSTTHPDPSSLSYTISGGSDNHLFSMNAVSGELTFITAPDFEMPQDSDKDNVYEVEVTVTDGDLSDAQALTIEVTDVNDNAPVFQNVPYFGNLAYGSVVFTVEATDADSGANGHISYSIIGGNTNNAFSIDQDGKISQNMIVIVPVELEVIATDHGAEPLSDTATVALALALIDLNLNDPVFDPESYSEKVPEDALTDQVVGTVTATDADSGASGTITYAITDGNTDEAFKIHPAKGIISVNGSLDRETIAGYTLTVTATDNGDTPRSDKATVVITVTDINDNAPQFQDEPYSADVLESAEIGDTVIYVGAVDADEGINANVSYAITGGNEGGKFAIDDTGAITVAGALDREDVASYNLTITATDGGEPPLSATATVSITILDVNDNAPVFQNEPYSASISEDAEAGHPVIRVEATDDDSGSNGEVTYSITSGDPDGYFAIDADAGKITTAKLLDREIIASFELEITATDGGSPPLSVTSMVKITIGDVNDNSPSFVNTPYETTVDEDIEPGSVVFTVEAVDPDEGDNGEVRYSITGGNLNDDFTIDAVSGEIKTANALDRETTPQYTLTIKATDQGAGNRSVETDVMINVADVNDTPPVVSSHSYELTEDETLEVDAPGVLENATDEDLNTTLTAALDQGPSNGTLDLRNDGSFTYTPDPDYHGNDSFTYRAFDGVNYSQPATVSIVIISVNDPPEFISTPVENVDQDAEYLYVIEVTDAESTSLILEAITLPDWLSFDAEKAELSGVPLNEHVGGHPVVLSVSDGSLTTEQSFTITVVDVNDPPFFLSVPNTAAIRNFSYTYNIITQDPDAGDTRNLQLLEKPDWLTFVNNNDGTGKLSGTPGDAHVGAPNSVKLRVVDKDGLMAVQEFDIKVIIDNSAPDFVSKPVNEVLEGEVYLYKLIAEDPNETDQLRIIAGPTLPQWLTLTDQGDGTAELTGVPDDADVGTHDVSVTVRDEVGASQTQNFSITVINVNEPPVFLSVPPTAATENVEYVYRIRTTDPDPDDSWNINAVELPDWLVLSAIEKGVAEIRGTPTNEHVGTHEIRIDVTDRGGLSSTQEFSIEVENVNDLPEFTSEPVTIAVVGETYTYQIFAVDDDLNDILQIEAVEAPAWLSFGDHGDGEAVLTGTPGDGDMGSHQVVLRVSDDQGGTNMQEFSIRVNGPPVVSNLIIETDEDVPFLFAMEDFESSFSDVDSDELQQIMIVSLPANGRLTLNNQPVSASDEIAADNLSNLRYIPAEDYFGLDEFEWKGFDGIAYSLNSAKAVVTIHGINDAPELLNISEAPLVFIPQKDEPTAVFENLAIRDVDDDEMASAQIFFNNRTYEMDQDVLLFETFGTITGNFNRSAGTLTFSGRDTKENYELTLQSVKYDNVSGNPSLENRTLNVYVDDGFESSSFRSRVIRLENGFVELAIPTGITPNGDGENDEWVIEGIELYPNCEIKILTRAGQVIFSSKGYERQWDGFQNGEKLPAGTYYYVIKLNQFDKSYTGAVTIIR